MNARYVGRGMELSIAKPPLGCYIWQRPVIPDRASTIPCSSYATGSTFTSSVIAETTI